MQSSRELTTLPYPDLNDTTLDERSGGLWNSCSM
jgi:hypothetical protein